MRKTRTGPEAAIKAFAGFDVNFKLTTIYHGRRRSRRKSWPARAGPGSTAGYDSLKRAPMSQILPGRGL